MQTATPFTTSAAPASSACRARRVGNATQAWEDWPVTFWSDRMRARYSAWRSAWSRRPSLLAWSRRFDARRLKILAASRHRHPQYQCPR